MQCQIQGFWFYAHLLVGSKVRLYTIFYYNATFYKNILAYTDHGLVLAQDSTLPD